MSHRRRGVASRLIAILVPVVVLSAGQLIAIGAPGRHAPLGQGGLDGSAAASMQLVGVPARVARVAEVPGSGGNEVWALGFSSAPKQGWNPNGSPGGQVVFLKYTPDAGWEVTGPPRNSGGAIINPVLSSFDIASNGEGWAVGDVGTLLRKLPGSNDWILHSSSGTVTDQFLNDVSVEQQGGGVVGYSAGAAGTVLRYQSGSWVRDDTTGVITPEGIPELVSIATRSSGEAWAVSGSGNRSLYVFRRTGGAWQRETVDEAIFDGPHPATTTGGFSVAAAVGASVAVDAGGAWVGGAIVPSDPTHPFGDQSAGDAARPFVIRFAGNNKTSYCPDVYWFRTDDQQVDTTSLCDAPFPLSAFDVTDLQVVGNEVFGAGLGLYRYNPDRGGWFREPDSNGYLISLAISAPNEGWAASTGNTFGAGGAIHSSTPTLGHWTSNPATPRARRWPSAAKQVLEAVTLAADGSGRAVAVGSDGAAGVFDPAWGWDTSSVVHPSSLHAVAWPVRSPAFAVGEGGAILRYDFGAWREDPASQEVTARSLFGIAFRSPTEGYAVGASGTILRYDGASWRTDPSSRRITQKDLFAIAASPSGYVAAGAGGTVIENLGAGWGLRADAGPLVTPKGRSPANLYAATPLPGGRFLLGGSHSSLLLRSSDGSYQTFEDPVEGTVLALGASPDSPLRLFASVSPDREKYKGDRLATGRSSLFAWADGSWRDVLHDRTRTVYISTDPSAPAEAILSIAAEPRGAGWAVSGYPENLPDEEGHLAVSPVGSVFRFDLTRDPRPPNAAALPDLPSEGISFAFFAETGCGRGLCSATIGTDTRSDAIPIRIRDEINRLARLPGGPRFVIFGGNSRSQGVPDEIRQFAKFLDTFAVPVYGALGDRELFQGLESSSFGYPNFLSPVTGGFLGNNRYWMEGLSDRPAPWGEGPLPPGFVPLSSSPVSGLASTYYAFDYAPAGDPLFRLVMLNSSTRSYGRTDGRDQNPQSPQGTWFADTLLDASLAEGGLPVIVAMNQPTIIPSVQPINNWPAAPQDKSTFEGTVVANRVSAVLTGGVRTNSFDWLPGRETPVVPVYILGGGGAPLGGLGGGLLQDSKVPSDGFYHAWHLITVFPSGASNSQMEVRVRPMPVLEHVSITPVDGVRQRAGQPLRFSATARALPGGFSDPEQSRANHFQLGWDSPVPCSGPGQGFGFCQNVHALLSEHRFVSENPEIADFVRPSLPLALKLPLRDSATNALVRDLLGHAGFLCTFKPGVTHVTVVAGLHKHRIPIVVTGGSGPCVEGRVPDPLVPPEPGRIPFFQQDVATDLPSFRPLELSQPVPVLFAPPPAPVLAPAPPASLGLARKEEHEEAEETQGQKGQLVKQAVRIEPSHRYEQGTESVIVVGGVVVAALAAALVVSALTGRRNVLASQGAWVSGSRSVSYREVKE